MEEKILRKLKQAQVLVEEARKLARDNDIAMYYKIHDFSAMPLEKALRDNDEFWDSSSFCANYRDDEHYW